MTCCSKHPSNAIFNQQLAKLWDLKTGAAFIQIIGIVNADLRIRDSRINQKRKSTFKNAAWFSFNSDLTGDTSLFCQPLALNLIGENLLNLFSLIMKYLD